MSFFLFRSIPGSTWPTLCDDGMSQVWQAYRQLDATQWLPANEVEAGQLRQARTLLEHCRTHVPYYRELFARTGVEPAAIQRLDDFRRIPLLTRRSYQERSESFLAEELPRGCRATTAQQTSGSTGSPTRVYQTNITNLWWCALYLRDLEWSGLDPRGSIACIRSTARRGSELEPFLQGASGRTWLPVLEPLLETGPAHLMDISQDPHRQLQWLRRLAPTYLLSYPSNLEVLAGLVRHSGRIPTLRAIQSVSDTLTEPVRGAIEAAFGVPVRNTYSCVEAGYLASPCPEGNGLHVHAESVLLEVLNEAGEPCQTGEAGRVYITTLTNFRGPLVRYELGDLAMLGTGHCVCGRGLPLLTQLLGKNPPMFRLPDGRRKSSTRLAYVVRKVGGHWQHQVAQKALDHVVVRLVPDPSWSPDHGNNMRREIQDFFEGPIRVDVELHERLPTPASGKFQNMVLELP